MDPGALLPVAYFRRRIEPIQHRHLDIHENHIELLPGEGIDSQATVLGHLDGMPLALKKCDRHLLVHRVVLGQQDAKRLPLSCGKAAWLLLRLYPCSRQGLDDTLVKIRLGDGLAKKGPDPELSAPGHITRVLTGAQHHHGCIAGPRQFPDALGRFESIHTRHMVIQQDEPVAAGRFRQRLDLLDRLGSTRDESWLHSPSTQGALEEPAVGGIVVNDKNPHALEADPGPVNCRAAAAIPCPEPAGEMEGAADTRLTLNPDPATHHVNKPRADGEAKPRASELPGRGGSGLRKGLEYFDPAFRENTDPRIPDREVVLHLSVMDGSRLDVENHLSLGGELDRVAQEVDHHLPQTRGVTDDQVACPFGNIEDQLQAFFVGLECKGSRRSPEAALERELDILQLNPAGLDLGEIKDVIDDPQQGVG